MYKDQHTNTARVDQIHFRQVQNEDSQLRQTGHSLFQQVKSFSHNSSCTLQDCYFTGFLCSDTQAHTLPQLSEQLLAAAATLVVHYIDERDLEESTTPAGNFSRQTPLSQRLLPLPCGFIGRIG
jgi:hypothetical protein